MRVVAAKYAKLKQNLTCRIWKSPIDPLPLNLLTMQISLPLLTIILKQTCFFQKLICDCTQDFRKVHCLSKLIALKFKITKHTGIWYSNTKYIQYKHSNPTFEISNQGYYFNYDTQWYSIFRKSSGTQASTPSLVSLMATSRLQFAHIKLFYHLVEGS